MKNISKLMVVVLVILTGVVYVGIVGIAQTSSEISATQKTWVMIGYHFDRASNPDEIRQVYASLPGDPSSSLPGDPSTSLQALFNQWKLGIITKDKVRPPLVAYAKSLAGYEAVESFRLGEWCSLLLTVEKDFKSNVENHNSAEVLSNMIDIEALARHAQEFIDTLAEDVPKDVLDALKSIADASAKIDIVAYLNSSDPKVDAEFVAAILSLPKYVATIVSVYMMGSF